MGRRDATELRRERDVPRGTVSQQQALEAITINAAHTIGLADITGSLRAGKRADFTVLNQDPLTCEPDELRDIEIAATVFEGRVFPIE